MKTDIDRDEAKRRFPEVEDIQDEGLRAKVVSVVQQFPEYFWTAPASKRHHPVEHQARHGLWLHTKRVCTTFERIAPSMVKQGHVTWDDIDKGRAGCILHDCLKFGEPPTNVKDTQGDHDVQAAEWLHRLDVDIPETVLDCVEAHNGPWYAGSPPRSHIEQTVHIADMNASDQNIRVAVKDPHPILEEQFPRVGVR